MTTPDFTGWIHVTDRKGTIRASHAFELWMAAPAPVAPEEWAAHLQVQGLLPHTAIPGGSPLQATVMAFVRLHQITLDAGGFVSDQPASKYETSVSPPEPTTRRG